MVNKINLIKGQRFGKLRFIKETKTRLSGSGRKIRRALFKCDCGSIKETSIVSVRKGKSTSCGCFRSEYIRQRQTKHGFTKVTSSEDDKKLYQVWKNMHLRCYDENNINYSNYHSRGIKVAKIWHDKEGLDNFIAWAKGNGFKPGLQLDRENNNKSYSPKNCRFVTNLVNASNKSNTLYIKHPKTGKTVRLIEYYKERPRKLTYSGFRHKYDHLVFNL